MSLLRQLVRRTLLVEGRVEDAKTKHPELGDWIDAVAKADPSGNQKYLSWAVKQKLDNSDNGAEHVPATDMAIVLAQFHKRASLFVKKDINSYSYKELRLVAQQGGNSKRQERKFAKGNADVLHEDDRWLVVYPRDRSSACFYGKGTKWCVAAAKDNAYHGYGMDNTFVYYVIDKIKEPQDPLSKMAATIHSYKDEENGLMPGDEIEDWFDATDSTMSDRQAREILGPQYGQFVDLMVKHAYDNELTATQNDIEQLRNSRDPAFIERMYRLHGQDGNVDKIVARNPATPKEVLMELVYDYKLWPALSENFELPDEVSSVIIEKLREVAKQWVPDGSHITNLFKAVSTFVSLHAWNSKLLEAAVDVLTKLRPALASVAEQTPPSDFVDTDTSVHGYLRELDWNIRHYSDRLDVMRRYQEQTKSA